MSGGSHERGISGDRPRAAGLTLAEGTGKRSVRVGYVIAVPLWKSFYRVCETPDRNGSK